MLTRGGRQGARLSAWPSYDPPDDQRRDRRQTTQDRYRRPTRRAARFSGTITVPVSRQSNSTAARPTAGRDIFAFGAIVYEMVAGQRAFAGDSQASLIAAILEREPGPISGDAGAHAAESRATAYRKCLAKDPDARWQSASDIADELRWLSTESGIAVSRAGVSARGARFRRWTIAAAALLVTSVASFVMWLSSQSGNRAGPRREAQYTQATFAGDVLTAVLSPDGQTVAYASGVEGRDVRVFVRDLTGAQSLEIWKGARATGLSWLPNGSQVLVAAVEEVWLVSRFGGASRLIARGGAYVAPSRRIAPRPFVGERRRFSC